MSKELYKRAKNPAVKKAIFDSLSEEVKTEILEEERKEDLEEQAGSSAMDTSNVGDFQVYKRIEDIEKEDKKKVLEEDDDYDDDDDDEEIDFYEDSFDEIANYIADAITSDDMEGLDDEEAMAGLDDLVDKAYVGLDVWTPYHDYENDVISAEEAEELEEECAKKKMLEEADFTTRFNAVMEEDKSLTDRMREKRRKSRQMKRLGGKMRSAKKRKANKMDMATIKKRVHVQAVKAVKEKMAKKQGKPYKDLPLSQQVKIDQKVKKKKALVDKFERKMLKKYRQQIKDKKAKGSEK